MRKKISDLKPGDHLCYLCESEEEHREVLSAFLRQGLKQGEKIIYIVDTHSEEAVLEYLKGDGIDIDSCLTHGQLEVLTRNETYLRHGCFDPESMIALLRAKTERALAEGYTALRITGEMSWALRGLPGSGRVVEYETKLNEFFPGSNCVGICQYDRRRFGPEILMGVLRMHPMAVIGQEVYENFYYVSADELMNSEASAVELRRWIQSLAERNRLEEALRESQERYHRLVDLCPDAIWIHIDGQIFFVNQAAINLMGAKHAGELIGKSIFEIIHPDYLQIIKNRLKQLKEGQIVPLMEQKFTRLDGKMVEIEVSSTPFLFEGKKAVLAIFRDITARKQAEEALLKSGREAKRLAQENELIAEIGRIISSTLNIEEVYERFAQELRKLIPFERVAINIINSEDNTFLIPYVWGSNVAEREAGRVVPLASTGTEWMRKNRLSLLVREENWEEAIGSLPGLLPLFRAGFRSVIMTPLVSKDQVIGTLNVQSFRQNAFTNEDVRLAERVSIQIAGAIANAQLFFEHKRAEEALREAEEKYRTILETVEEGYYEVDLAGNFTFVNDSLSRMLRYTKDELLGMNNQHYMDKETARKVFKAFNQVYRTGEPYKFFDWEITTKDGARKFYESSVSLRRNLQGEPIGFRGIMRDITQRRLAEEALRESEDRYRDLVEYSQYLICTYDLEGKILSINKGAAKLLGYDPHVLLQMNIRDILAPEAKPGFDQYLATIRDRGVGEGLMLVQTAKGEKRIWEYSNTLRSEGVTKPIVRSMAHDITERVREERFTKRVAQENAIVAEVGKIIGSTLEIDKVYELFAEEVRKVIPFDWIAITIIEHEKGTFHNAYILGGNISGRGIMEAVSFPGSFTEEIMRRRASQLIQTEDLDEMGGRFPKLLPFLQRGFRSFMAVPMISHDQVIGVLHIYSIRSQAYKEVDVNLAERVGSQIAGAIANALLFAQHKQAQEALRSSEEAAQRLAKENEIIAKIGQIISSTLNIEEVYERFAAEVKKLIEFDRLSVNLINLKEKTISIPYAWGTNANDPQPGGVIPFVGSATEEVFKTRSSLIIQTEDIHYIAIQFPNYLPSFGAGIRSSLFVPLISKDEIFGSLAILSKKINAYTERDCKLAENIGFQIAGAIANAQLFSERKKLEAQLLQAQKMEAIGTLAGGIAHDFNNILAAILGYTELANLDTAEESKAKPNLQKAIKATHRAKNLVQQILAFSRQNKQERKPIDIIPIIKESLILLRASLPTTIEIREHIEEETGIMEGDPTQIQQVLMNLGTNAAHAMSENGGILEVFLAKFDVVPNVSSTFSGLEPGPYLKLSVLDTGHGMTPEILRRIFDPYFTTKEVGKGTGLGLAMVHGIVKSHGGAVMVSSEPGKGTTFDVYFPRIEISHRLSEAPRMEPFPQGRHECILFIDDEQAIVEIGQNMLAKLGYEVVARTSSLEALELFRKNPRRFDLVITDMTMPNMTGDRLAQEMMRIRPGIPVILCTGFSERITEDKAKALGMEEFVMKPLVMGDLAKTIRMVLDRRKNPKAC